MVDRCEHSSPNGAWSVTVLASLALFSVQVWIHHIYYVEAPLFKTVILSRWIVSDISIPHHAQVWSHQVTLDLPESVPSPWHYPDIHQSILVCIYWTMLLTVCLLIWYDHPNWYTCKHTYQCMTFILFT